MKASTYLKLRRFFKTLVLKVKYDFVFYFMLLFVRYFTLIFCRNNSSAIFTSFKADISFALI